MQICHLLGCKQIKSTSDRVLSIFRNNAGKPLSTVRSNAVTLECSSTSRNFAFFDT